MLILAKKHHEISFADLMAVYEEENRRNGELMYPQLPENQQILNAEQAFYQYLREGFFAIPGAVYAIWEEDGRYVSALRLEPYEDGLLLEALETAPAHRRQGYATRLIQEVQRTLPNKIYSHVRKSNVASLAIHEKCGFCRVLEYARYIDGSVARNAVTLCYR